MATQRSGKNGHRKLTKEQREYIRRVERNKKIFLIFTAILLIGLVCAVSYGMYSSGKNNGDKSPTPKPSPTVTPEPTSPATPVPGGTPSESGNSETEKPTDNEKKSSNLGLIIGIIAAVVVVAAVVVIILFKKKK